jgi:protein SCO1
MTPRRLLLLLAIPLLVVLVGGSFAVARQEGPVGGGVAGPSSGPYRGSEVGPKLLLPKFTLQEWNGKRVSSEQLRDKVVLVTFLETRCREACPIIADQIGLGLQRLRPAERAKVYALAVSTHPGDDTPANVREFLRVHRVQDRLHYLIGSERQLRPVWNSFYVLAAFDTGDANTHSASVRIFNGRGRWVSTLHPRVDLTPSNLAHDVRIVLRSM